MKELVGNYYVTIEDGSGVVEPLPKPRLRRTQYFTQETIETVRPGYVRDYIYRKYRYIGTVYLIHFHRPLGNERKVARHYIGFTKDLDKRLVRHKAGQGAAIMAAVEERQIPYRVVRTWTGDRYFERSLKRFRDHKRFCPICKRKEGRN
jgi:predicted GIY-YIG superfamily endonuclease